MDKFLSVLPGEIYSSLIVVVILSILFILIGRSIKRADPLKPTKGLAFIGEYIVTFINDFIDNNMGKKYDKLKPYFMLLFIMIPSYFLVGLLGLPSPMTYWGIPLSFALITFVLIHANSIRFTKWGYFKRFVDPFPKVPVFLPVNIISMFAPIISLSFRMFGNALSGMIIMQLIYWSTETLTGLVLDVPGLNIFGPLLAPVLHAYFDLFSAVIQTMVFVYLTVFFVKGEEPDEIEENALA